MTGLRIYAAVLLTWSGAALAEQAPHQHGVAQAQVALDGRDLLIEMQIPAADLVGFEHAPQNAEQKARIAQLQTVWSDHARWLQLAPAAACTLVQLRVQVGEEPAEHADHAHAHGHDDAHDDHEQHGHAHDANDHADHADSGPAHMDGRVSISMQCAAPQHLTELQLNPFALLPALERVRYQSLWPSGQGAGTLDPRAHTIKFSAP